MNFFCSFFRIVSCLHSVVFLSYILLLTYICLNISLLFYITSSITFIKLSMFHHFSIFYFFSGYFFIVDFHVPFSHYFCFPSVYWFFPIHSFTVSFFLLCNFYLFFFHLCPWNFFFFFCSFYHWYFLLLLLIFCFSSISFTLILPSSFVIFWAYILIACFILLNIFHSFFVLINILSFFHFYLINSFLFSYSPDLQFSFSSIFLSFDITKLYFLIYVIYLTRYLFSFQTFAFRISCVLLSVFLFCSFSLQQAIPLFPIFWHGVHSLFSPFLKWLLSSF